MRGENDTRRSGAPSLNLFSQEKLMRYTWKKLAFAAFSSLGLLTCMSDVKGLEKLSSAAEMLAEAKAAYGKQWYVWYRYSGKRWNINGPYSRYEDAQSVADSYRSDGADVAVLDHK
jgi:hypothetical protein